MNVGTVRPLAALLASPRLDSRARSADTTARERWLGYLVGPAAPLLLNALLAVYLNVYYTDVVGLTRVWGGAFLAVLPLVTNALVAVANVLVGRAIDRTRTRQGKARPWLLVAAPLMTLSGLLLFAVPDWGQATQLVWVAVSYNLYYSLAFSIYGVSHNLMVPLSTTDTSQRGKLSVFNQVASIMMTGIVVALVFPALVMPRIGVDPGAWFTVMGTVSFLVLPVSLLEYFFTRERVSEIEATREHVARRFRDELRAVFRNRYVWLFFAYFALFMLGSNIKNVSLVYYSNYVLGTYNDGITQTLLSAIGGIPLGIGVLIVWPLAKRFGKRNLMVAGFFLYGAGSAINWAFADDLPMALVGQLVKNLGSLPAVYIFVALFADVLDNIEWRSGFRVDGLATSVLNVIQTTLVGLATGLYNATLSAAGYVAPREVDGVVVAAQTEAAQQTITFWFVGFESISSVVIVVLLAFLGVERDNARHHLAPTIRVKEKS